MRPETCDLLDIVRESVEGQRAAWPDRSLSITLPRRTRLPLVADADRIGQVVTNYVTNALKYSEPDRTVTVRVSAAKGQARVEVRDEGPGLTPEQQTRLFERFYRVPGIEQRSGSGVGLGLGLHICKTIIERHDGHVGVESAPGKGSVFWFTLPLADE
jgi:signal transduction histidine kinase